MAYILCIDTALEQAGIALVREGKILLRAEHPSPSGHASWIHLAIRKMMEEAGMALKQLDALAVVSGPGSYTGLRVGLATAKGICYALDRPLLLENTLKLTAFRTLQSELIQQSEASLLIRPMIDARRMEVFTAAYNKNLDMEGESGAAILTEQSFQDELDSHEVWFCGNGSAKFQAICPHRNARFMTVTHDLADLAEISWKSYRTGSFASLAYSEPEYLKNVYTGK